MPSPTSKNIDNFIEIKQSDLCRFTRLLRSVNAIPKGTTGWFYLDVFTNGENQNFSHIKNRHLFVPFDIGNPNGWIDKTGTKQVEFVTKEDVE